MSDSLTYSLDVNGQLHEVTARPASTLLYVLRDTLGLTGTKFNCEQGECGACTVLIDGRPVNSCLVLARTAEGAEIVTVEGLARDRLAPMQQAFVEADASQCGYCTPGMIIAAAALLERDPDPTRDAIEEAISGNYCRCTGYESIINAIKKAAEVGRKRVDDEA